MKKTALVIGFLIAAGTGAVAQDRTIVLMGASTSAGVGATTYDSSFAGRYAHYLKNQDPAWTFTNLAVSGYTTFQLMPTGYAAPSGRPKTDPAHNITKALSLHPRVLLLCMGTNDIANGYPASQYEANYDSLHAIAERAGIPFWVTTPLPRGVDAAKRSMILALRDRIMSRDAPRAINFYDSLGDAQGNYYPAFNSGDNIHTNNHGHRLLFERVVAASLISSVTALAGSPGPNLPREEASTGRFPMLYLAPGLSEPRDLRGRMFGR
ncbi:MAG: SGNH/GDSL hydrolase family protein [Fibrobacteria bacterium]